ncbi:MAG: NAD(P)/FAD-dependent oxidoreductase [Thermaerobacter sp.]|nr:NAD(P)/FAD-dependent oxidoreductase [Thermaerobacter sp.]
MASNDKTPAHVVIVGAGFAGLYAARRLARAPVRVTVLDRRNHHLFQPLLYQVATAGLAPGEIAAPIRHVLRGHPRTQVLLADVRGIDLDRQAVKYDGGEIEYDYLLLATGARHSYFGHPEWEPLAPGLKTLEDATEIRHRILLAYEAAERTDDPVIRQALLDFVVVGAGPTGVELAGAIAEIARRTLRRNFRNIDPAASRVFLVEAGKRVLPSFPEDLGLRAEAVLRRMGVEVQLGAAVEEVTSSGVRVAGEFLPARTVLWAAGVTASPLGAEIPGVRDRVGRVRVAADLTVEGHPEVSLAGDMALVVDEAGSPLPGIAPVAIQEGVCAAENILRAIAGRERRPFHYRDRGVLATIGRSQAVARIGRVHLHGFVAWAAWLLVHIMYLIGFGNRVAVLWRWTLAYITFERADRLITRGPGAAA